MRKQMIEGQACFFKSSKEGMKAEVVRPVAWTVKYNSFVRKIRAMIANQREVNATKPSSQRYREWPGYGVDWMRLNAFEGGTPTVAWLLRNDEAEQIAKLEEEVEVQMPIFSSFNYNL